VFGEGSFKKKSNTKNTTAPMGTARLVRSGLYVTSHNPQLIQKHHLQLLTC
jgi:hypothetical protein